MKAELAGLSYTPLSPSRKRRRAADCLPQGGTPPPARFFIMAPRGNPFFGVSRSMRSWPQGYVQRGIERERERDTYVGVILLWPYV